MKYSLSEIKSYLNNNNVKKFIYNSVNNNIDGVEFSCEFSNVSIFPRHGSMGFSNDNKDVICFKNILDVETNRLNGNIYIKLHSIDADHIILAQK